VCFPNTLWSHEQQTYRGRSWKFVDKSFRGDLRHLDLLRRQPLTEEKALKLTMSISRGNSRIGDEPVDTGLSEAVAALHTSNAILDEMNPARPVTFRTTWYTGWMGLVLTHRGIVHEVTLQLVSPMDLHSVQVAQQLLCALRAPQLSKCSFFNLPDSLA